jgi:hypothetical protein
MQIRLRLKIERGEMVSLLEIDIEHNPERCSPAVQFR